MEVGGGGESRADGGVRALCGGAVVTGGKGRRNASSGSSGRWIPGCCKMNISSASSLTHTHTHKHAHTRAKHDDSTHFGQSSCFHARPHPAGQEVLRSHRHSSPCRRAYSLCSNRGRRGCRVRPICFAAFPLCRLRLCRGH